MYRKGLALHMAGLMTALHMIHHSTELVKTSDDGALEGWLIDVVPDVAGGGGGGKWVVVSWGVVMTQEVLGRGAASAESLFRSATNSARAGGSVSHVPLQGATSSARAAHNDTISSGESLEWSKKCCSGPREAGHNGRR